MISKNSISESRLTEYKQGVSNVLTATRKIERIPKNRNNLQALENIPKYYKKFQRNNLFMRHSGIQKYGGNPGNLTRLNGFRVHSIYMIRFPPR